ncbi:MAG: 1,4-beta-glucanase [Ruminococcus sp.]|nr:1,4-beta-glucanase [Ruminococcus sp.]
MVNLKKTLAGFFAVCIGTAFIPFAGRTSGNKLSASAAEDISAKMEWGTLKIGGGGFVSGIVTGKKAMYARTDVGGAYRYNYSTESWEQLFGFINEADRGLLSVDAMAIDPTDDNTVYFLCGCAYFSSEKTVIFKTTDGGKTFEEINVTDLIQVHGNGNGRQTGEAIAVDPDDPNTIYCGGDVYAGDSCLIKSTDGGKTWKSVKSFGDLGLFKNEVKWPTWTNNMRHALENDEYYAQNGIASIYIYGGKVYVGTSTTGKNSVVVANVSDDKFTDISSELDDKNYPGRITGDGQGNIFFAFQGAVCVGNGGTSGSVKKLDTKTGKITDISPLKHLYRTQTDEFVAASEGGYSGISVDPANPDHMVCSTCGLFANAQLWQEWTDDHGPSWGDKFFKSEDGGEHWIETTPGISPFWGQPPIADYLADGGYDWIRDKAIHWVGAYVIDPAKPDRSISTSGNGLFACDDTWSDTPQFHFHPDGIEEVVALDFVSVPNGANYSAIGDYDGFIHESVSEIPMQYQPNIGSTSAIAYCPSAPNVMARLSNNTATGCYSTDSGKTWKAMNFKYSGGKLSITEISKGKYRILNSDGNGSAIAYTDDFGATWGTAKGIDGSKTTYTLVDPNDPSIVYGSGIKYNDYWASDPNKTEPSLEESHYSFYISTDYGATFTETQIGKYDQCDHTGDLAYISKGTVAMAVGWNGMYIISDNGKKVEKLETAAYVKSVGYGAPEKSGSPNTLYIYGKPDWDDAEGIYRSTDAGKTWVCINTDHLYGGTGNGNFIVGDMNEFGTVYMSTVGCGIVYGRLSDGKTQPITTTAKTTAQTTTSTTAKTTTSTTAKTTVTTTASITSATDEILWGDANCDDKVNMADVVLIMQSMANPDKYGLKGNDKSHITEQGLKNADVAGGRDGVTNLDALAIQKLMLDLVDKLPVD